MLTIEEIKKFIDADSGSEKKRLAKIGQDYYEAKHDIRNYELYYYNADGDLIKDETRSNIKISHPFFTEIVDQAVQYILSGKDGYVRSDIPALQAELDSYFNENEDFTAELTEVLAGCQTKGCDFMYAYKNEENKTAFQSADSLGVIEVRAKDTDSKAEHIIYWYVDRIEKNSKEIKRIQVWDSEYVSFYVQEGNGDIKVDDSEPNNPRPHTLYQEEGNDTIYYGTYGVIPFFRMDNNKKQTSSLKPIKEIIDDYDLMACGLSNNLQDASEYLVVVSGFEGDNLDQLITNTKTKKHIGLAEGGAVEYKTVDIPYEARRVKLELDEKNIYRFGMGLNTSGLKDSNATTNIGIKAAYSLLDLKCSKLIVKLKQFLRKLIKVVLVEINELNGTDYQLKDVYFKFLPEIMSNELENAQVEQANASKRETEINILLNLQALLDNETLMQLICEQLDIDYEEIKGKLPDPNEAENAIATAQGALDNVPVAEEGVVVE